MGVQKADDPARNLTNVWLGSDPIRDTSRARYTSWGVFVVLWGLLGMLLWLVLPLGLLAVVAALWLTERLRTVVASRAIRLAYALLLIVGLAIIVPDPTFWAYPPSGWVAWLPALVAAVLITRSTMRHVDANRPISYWRNTLSTAARGPRARRTPVTRDHDEPARTDPIDLSELDVTYLSTEGHAVARYEPVVTAVEAERWLPADLGATANFRAWLTFHGFWHTLIPGRNGGPAVVDIRLNPDAPRGLQESRTVEAGSWFIFVPATGRRGHTSDHHVMTDKAFRGAYAAVAEPKR